MPQPRVAAPLQVVAAVGLTIWGAHSPLGRWISSLGRITTSSRRNVRRDQATEAKEFAMNTASSREVHRWRAFAVLAVSYFMTIVDLTIVNVALPTIGRELYFSESNLQWVVTAYGLTFGGFLLLGGRAADLLGRRRILMLGLALFTAASLGAGLATSAGFLIAMRGLQGFGAAVVLPAALSVVMNMFAEGAERNKALGLWGGIGAAGATIGLITGGLLTRYLGWEYIFFLNLPIGIAALLLAPRIVPECRLETVRRRFDPLGAVTVTGGLLLGGSFFAFIFIGTLYMQQVLGYSALQTGVAWLAASLTSVALAGLAQLLVTRVSAGPVMALGMALVGGGALWAAQVPAQGHFWSALAGPFFIAGAGTAFAFIPVSIAGLAGVSEREAGLASGLLNTSQQLGGAIGVALASTVAATHYKTLIGDGQTATVALTGGFQWAFWVCGAIALLALPTTAVLLRRKAAATGVERAVPALEGDGGS